MPRIVLLTELYYPEETSTGYFVTKIAEGVASAGFCDEVQVICSQPSYRKKGIMAPMTEVRNKVHISRIRATRLNRDSLFARVFINLSVTSRMSILLLKKIKEGDILVMLTNPPLLPLAATLIAWLKQVPSVLIIHDVYPDVLVPTGILKKADLLYRMMDGIQQVILRRSLKVIVLGRDMQKLIAGKIGLDPGRIPVASNWGFLQRDTLNARRCEGLRRDLGFEGKFVIQMSGNLGRTHGLADLLELASRFRRDSRFHFFVFGDGAGRKWMEEEIHKRGLHNMTIRHSCDMEELPYYLSLCDLFLLPIIQGMEGISVPSRMYNVMALGNPILAVASEQSELAQVIFEEDIGFVAAPGDHQAIVDAIESAYGNPDRLQGMRDRAERSWRSKYSEQICVSRYAELLKQLASSRTDKI